MNKLLIAPCVAGVLGLIVALPAGAADMSVMRDWQSGPSVRALPYPRSERAQAVWNERACWSQCGSYNAWAMAACLEQDAQGRCLKLADRADRHCQRSCRTAGGPLVPDIFDALQ
jgi:hypothetical protein